MKDGFDCERAIEDINKCLVEDDTNDKRELPAIALPSVCVGRLLALVPDADPMIDFPGNPCSELLPARSVIALNDADIGREVTLVFEDGDATRPIILGVVQHRNRTARDERAKRETMPNAEIRQDENTLHLSASQEITLSCGKASITLTSAGKILLRGAYLLSRSSGVNRIKGGSVQIN